MNLEGDFLEEDESELFEQHCIVADPGQMPLRIDKFLSDRIEKLSRNKLQTALKAGLIRVNGKPVKPNFKIQAGHEIKVFLPEEKRTLELIPENLPITVAADSDDWVVVNKAAGMVVHPGYGNYSGTLVNALLYHFKNLSSAHHGNEPRPGLVHRLDKDTTGLMVVAKNDEAHANLARQFFDRTTGRRYNAIVWGDFDEDEGTITGNLGRSLKDRKLMQVFEDGSYGKPAITHWKVLKRFGYVTFIECRLETGRTHQIRAHFKHIGHPLFGDVQYGGDRILKGTTFTKYKQFVQNCFAILPRQALHARTLSFDDPATGKRVEFTSDLPDDMKTVLERWENYINSRKE